MEIADYCQIKVNNYGCDATALGTAIIAVRSTYGSRAASRMSFLIESNVESILPDTTLDRRMFCDEVYSLFCRYLAAAVEGSRPRPANVAAIQAA